MFGTAVFLIVYLSRVWTLPAYRFLLPGTAAIAAVSFLLFLKTVPLCPRCKLRFWTILKRTPVCCFTEKLTLRKTFVRAMAFVSYLFFAAGLFIMYFPYIYPVGVKLGEYAASKMRKPGYERFLKEKQRLEKEIASAKDEKQANTAKLKLAFLYYEAGMKEHALKLCNETLAKAPDDVNAAFFKAVLLGEKGEALLEEKLYQEIVEREKDRPEIYINLGLVYLKNKLPSQALKSFTKALKAFDKMLKRCEAAESTDERLREDLRILAGVASYYCAIACKLTGKSREKMKYYEKARNLGHDMGSFSEDVKRYR